MSEADTSNRSLGLLALATPVILGVGLVFGGATHGEALSSAIVRLACLPLLGMAVWRLWVSGLPRGSAWPVLVLIAAAALPLIQLIPLPPGVWSGLPGREPIAKGFEAAQMALPWLPISLAPSATRDAFFSLIPPAAIFLATIQLNMQARRLMALLIVAVAFVSTILGAAQIASGADSTLRFYAVTNVDSGVGFFANRNHFADLLALSLPLTAYWAGQGGSRAPGQRGLYLLIAAGLLLIFIVSLGVSRSRAGIGLGVFAIVASAVLLWLQRGVPRIVPVLMVAGLVIGGGLVAAFALEPILQRFRDPAAEARVTMLPGVLAAVRSFFPVGSGLGSFVPIYQMFERPDTVIIPYVNHAHDDYLELAIEAGLAGLMVLLAGLTWLASASVRAVFRPANNDPNLARAAALVVLIMLVHSIVDYPLRTAALSAVFAFACALLVPPQESERVRRRRRVSGPANDASAEAANVRLPNRPSVQTSRTS